MNFTRESLAKKQQLGDDGKEGKTYLANLDGKNIAVKTFKPTKSSAKIQREADFQQTCADVDVAPNVYYVNCEEKYIAMDKLDTLPAKTYKHNQMPDDLQYMICALMGRMDGVNVMHGDMNALNVMCDERGRPYMIDFGFAKKISPKMVKKYNGHPNVKVSLWGLIRGFKRYKVVVDILVECVAADEPTEYFERGEELLATISSKGRKRKR
jgi:RIO-like serine/threonine protein kinase